MSSVRTQHTSQLNDRGKLKELQILGSIFSTTKNTTEQQTVKVNSLSMLIFLPFSHPPWCIFPSIENCSAHILVVQPFIFWLEICFHEMQFLSERLTHSDRMTTSKL